MDPTVVTALLVLLGTIVGAVATTAATGVATVISARTERRRVAVDAAMKEWERLVEHGGKVYPPSLFVYYNVELFRLIDKGALTPKSYAQLTKRRSELAVVMQADTEAMRTKLGDRQDGRR